MNKEQFKIEMQKKAESIDFFIHQYFEQLQSNISSLELLRNSIYYSASSGGKRFRPVLALAVADMYEESRGKVLPFAAAVEFIHTYSLIHDDLPCMDNDDFRRGKPTNHKMYGEATALLSGDALLTEAFFLIADAYKAEPILSNKLVSLLSLAAGMRGMIAGQIIDMKGTEFNQDMLNLLHNLKTGRLIRVAIEGAAEIVHAPSKDIQLLSQFGESLGLAFQVADDLLDADRIDEKNKSFVGLYGVDGTKKYLENISQHCRELLNSLSKKSAMLEQMVEYNLRREK